MSKQLINASVLFIAVFLIIAFAGRAVAQSWLSQGPSSGQIALIPVEGVITGSSGSGGLLAMEAGASSVHISELLEQAADDPEVKAVVLRVNSPGGSAAASDEIYHAILSCRKQKPVVVSMADVAASGGYYLSAAADSIYANGATLTGSIGVVFNLVNWKDLAENVGISDMTISAGEFKDIGSPWREMSDNERAMLSGLVDDVHRQFIAAVAEGRSAMTEEQVTALATGMVFTGEKARENGLVDEIGGLQDAADKARSLAGVGADVPLEYFGSERSLIEQLLSMELGVPGISAAATILDPDPLSALARGLYLSETLNHLEVR